MYIQLVDLLIMIGELAVFLLVLAVVVVRSYLRRLSLIKAVFRETLHLWLLLGTCLMMLPRRISVDTFLVSK